MASIIAVGSKTKIPRKYLENVFNNNSNIGMLFSVDGVLQKRKPSTNFDNFYRFYQEKKQYPGVIFCQRDTKYNIYTADAGKPFILSPTLYVIIEEQLPLLEQLKHSTKSELQVFVEKVLRPIARLDENMFKMPSFSCLLAKYIGVNTRLVFFYANGDHYIYNMNVGSEEKDENDKRIWFSNKQYDYSPYKGTKQTFVYPRQQQVKHIVDSELGEPEDWSKYLEPEEENDIGSDIDELLEEQDRIDRIEKIKRKVGEVKNGPRRIKTFQELSDIHKQGLLDVSSESYDIFNQLEQEEEEEKHRPTIDSYNYNEELEAYYRSQY